MLAHRVGERSTLTNLINLKKSLSPVHKKLEPSPSHTDDTWCKLWASHPPDGIRGGARETAAKPMEGQAMKKLQHVRTRRQLLRATAVGVLRATAVGAASIPFLALARKSASANQNGTNQNGNPQNGCLLKGTKISTPAGDRLVQDLQIGDEVQTLAGRKTIKWIGYNKFTKEEGRAWQDSVMPIRVARFAIDDHTPHCDLYLSPWHCIFLNQALIPVMYLINEATIAQRTPSDMPAIE